MSFHEEPRQIRRLTVRTRLNTGRLRLVYVPSKLIVHGNATATASNIAASETLFRAGIACNLLSQILLCGWPLALYDLLKGSTSGTPRSCWIDCVIDPDSVAE